MTATLTVRPDLIQVTYKVLSDRLIDPEKKARSMAWGQTTAGWAPTEAAGQKRLSRHRGVVLGIDERTHVDGQPYEYFLTLGFPPENTEGDIPSLLTLVLGKLSLEGRIRVESIQLPDAYLKGKGPRFGIKGLRDLVGEPGKPLLMGMFSPGVGPTPAEFGALFYDLAMGGVHLIKEDDILPNIAACPVEKRLEEGLKAAARAKSETGRETLYAVNVTGPAGKLITHARRLAKQGASCFLFNVLAYGYGLLEELASVGVPLVAHPGLAGVFSGSSDAGFSYATVLGTLMRLGGADIVLFPSSEGSPRLSASDMSAVRHALTGPMGSLPKTFPAPSGGIHPGLMPPLLKEFGADVVFNAGRSLYDHPQGARAGAKAFRQAIQWVTKRGNLGGISQREFPELMDALRLWGKK